MSVNMEAVELMGEDGTSYKFIVSRDEAKKMRTDPLCASQYLVAVKHLHDSTPVQPTKKPCVADQDKPVMTPMDMNSLEPYRWTGKAVRLLITLRREMDGQFERPRCKKLRLWDEIAMKMMDAGNYVVSGFVCDKKWRNLLSTYRRIKDKNQQDKSTWEYFDLVDDWVGQKAPASPSPVELRGESDVSMDGLSSSSSSEPFSDGSSATYGVTGGLKMNVDVRKSPAATVNRPAGRHKRACFCNDEPPKWFEEYLKQRLADQNKRYELEERRLALEAAQVKAMENLVAAIAASVRKGNLSS